MYVIHTYKGMFFIQNDTKLQKLSAHSHTIVFRYIASYGGNFLKRILTHLYSTKYNEINICHIDVQNHTSYKK